MKRFVVPLEDQLPAESEKKWRKVTEAIMAENQEAATLEKTALEDEQRRAVAERAESGTTWLPKHFAFDGNTWRYRYEDLRPWDDGNDLKEFEHDYMVEVQRRHQTPIMRTSSLISVESKVMHDTSPTCNSSTLIPLPLNSTTSSTCTSQTDSSAISSSSNNNNDQVEDNNGQVVESNVRVTCSAPAVCSTTTTTQGASGSGDGDLVENNIRLTSSSAVSTTVTTQGASGSGVDNGGGGVTSPPSASSSVSRSIVDPDLLLGLLSDLSLSLLGHPITDLEQELPQVYSHTLFWFFSLVLGSFFMLYLLFSIINLVGFSDFARLTFPFELTASFFVEDFVFRFAFCFR